MEQSLLLVKTGTSKRISRRGAETQRGERFYVFGFLSVPASLRDKVPLVIQGAKGGPTEFDQPWAGIGYHEWIGDPLYSAKI
jgi:hypothetical protein